MRSRRRFWGKQLGLLLLVVGVGTFLALRPSWLKLPPCLFHKTTGLYCPGCGSTRALTRLAQGDLLGSLRLNLLTLPTMLVCAYLYALDAYDDWTGRVGARKSVLALGASFLLAAIVWMTLRNIPCAALDWTRPPV